ncbi:MAG TPA: agmatinase family protein [Dinghuibacter sp.]|uniref:agmatinase family protein n=1 Tax=Dinghuibacter sp. TaxID=2024697 RepID=UPI002B5A2068|nr:agmatinase family protein [Dinghuibacter sp.]HTJ12691.1 agmatinase family protein [Dinghuibacter sp.]
MTDLSHFDPSGISNPKQNIFGLPFSEEDARLVILPVPWEVTVSYHAGTARVADHIFQASLQVELFDPEAPEAWKQGIHMRPPDKRILMKNDYLRKEAELYIQYISEGEAVEANKFMSKTLREVNEGSAFLNQWVYDQTSTLLGRGKLVGLLGGDHSTILGYVRALGERHGSFGILQIDAHCDLRKAYTQFIHSHASVMYNVLLDVPAVTRLVQVGIRDYSEDEWAYVCGSGHRVITYLDREIGRRQIEGETWKSITDEIVSKLPDKVYISFDIDGLDPKLCPNTGTPVPGGLGTTQVDYLCRMILESGRSIIGFDLVEVGTGTTDWDANVGARQLLKLSYLLIRSNTPKGGA